jgi:hypothetical protein
MQGERVLFTKINAKAQEKRLLTIPTQHGEKPRQVNVSVEIM